MMTVGDAMIEIDKCTKAHMKIEEAIRCVKDEDFFPMSIEAAKSIESLLDDYSRLLEKLPTGVDDWRTKWAR